MPIFYLILSKLASGADPTLILLFNVSVRSVKAQVPQNLLIVICFWKNVLQYL